MCNTEEINIAKKATVRLLRLNPSYLCPYILLELIMGQVSICNLHVCILPFVLVSPCLFAQYCVDCVLLALLTLLGILGQPVFVLHNIVADLYVRT